MELTINVEYEQILKLAKQLPAAKIIQLKSDLNTDFIENKAEKEISDFQRFLLSGPVMTDDQLKDFKQNRESWNVWRKK
ncbi:hypothetical protein [Dyadobacter luticola]|uniref:Uncharacterized protein n=1 Tax=Dyadobacter luticola TaxID=1979387 RepID=A0A5R9KSM0_9BACT|nr:hypothetical protein [Dyadobacter luticola]TLU99104.1 hypothetical protein FEN17_21235 [Dyadobacter luticola]